MSTYFAILTEVGEAKLANAIALGQTLKLKNLAVGDGNGNLPMPVRTQKTLVHEVRRAGLNQLTIDPANTSQIIVEQVLPEDVGGWWIREIGIYDEAGDLCAVANCPPSYKPLMAEGSGRTQVVRIVLIVASTAAIELKIDPSVILATRKYVDDQDITVRAYGDAQLAKHLATLDPHPQLAQRSYVDQQASSVRAYGEQQLAGHLGAADPHPQYSMKTVATLPKFTASTKLANAEFVQQAHGSMVKYVGVNASRTLTADDMGAALYFTAPGLTLTIPSPDSLGIPANSGKYFKLFGLNQVTGTITSGAGVIIGYDVGDVKNVVIKQGQFITLMAISGQVWQVIDSTAEMFRNADFANYFNNTAPTQAQFNRSTKLATTEFVQRELGSLAGFSGITKSRDTTADDIGKALWFQNTGFTLTLTRPIDLIKEGAVLGRCIKLFAFGGHNGTISVAADAYLAFDVVPIPKIVIKTGQTLTLMAVNNDTWQVIDSTAELGRNASFAGVLAGSGHKCMPDDFIMQWQTVDVPVATTDIATKSFSFPIAFKEAVFGCTASVLGIGATLNANAFVSAMPTSVNGGVVQNNYTNSNVSVFIISIGK